LEYTTALPERVTELTVTEMGLSLGDAMPVTVAMNVASVPLAAYRGFVGPTRLMEVGPAGTMSLKLTDPMECVARNESASV
jgi:hypothetical protein